MSQTILTDKHGLPSEEPSSFFGAEQAQSAEEIPATIWADIDDFVDQHPGGQERLIPLLHMVQKQLGYLPFPIQEVIADRLGLSPVQVYGVVSFYHFFTTTPRARHQIKVCLGTACFVRNSQQLMAAMKETCRTEVGGISDDGLFNLDQVRCIGACGLAPAITIDDQVHGSQTVTKARRLVDKLRKAAEKEAKAAEKTTEAKVDEKVPETKAAEKTTEAKTDAKVREDAE